jgi:hypothetical protein
MMRKIFGVMMFYAGIIQASQPVSKTEIQELFGAVYKNSPGEVEMLLKRHTEEDRSFMCGLCNRNFQTPWEVSMQYEDSPNMIRVFLKYGLPLNAQNLHGFNIINLAIWYRRKKVFDLLIENGANVNREKDQWPSPLYLIAHSFDGSENDMHILGTLLERGADPYKKVFGSERTILKSAVPAAKIFIKFFLKWRQEDIIIKKALELCTQLQSDELAPRILKKLVQSPKSDATYKEVLDLL